MVLSKLYLGRSPNFCNAVYTMAIWPTIQPLTGSVHAAPQMANPEVHRQAMRDAQAAVERASNASVMMNQVHSAPWLCILCSQLRNVGVDKPTTNSGPPPRTSDVCARAGFGTHADAYNAWPPRMRSLLSCWLR